MDIYDIVDDPEKQLEVFSGIIKRMNASNDHDETLITIISEIKTIMYTDSILLYLVDQELYNLHYEMSIGPLGSKFFGNIIDCEKPLAVRAYTTSCSLYSNDPQEDSAFIPMKEVLGEDLKNILFVPLKVRKKNIGSLFLINKKNGKFIEKDTVVMSLFANIVSLALVNKMVYDRAQSRAYEVGALYQMSISINKCETIEEILNDNISIVCEAFEVHRVSVILKENGVFKFKAGIGIDENVLKYGVVTVDDNVLAEVLRTGKPVYSIDVDRDIRFRPNKNLRYTRNSFMVAPIVGKDEIIGFLSATERNINKAFNLSNLSLLEMLAQQIGENYMHVLLSEESKIKESLTEEINFTEQLQKSVLPKEFPSNGLFDIAAVSIPSKNVGGDFYDYIKISDTKYGLVIADVSGKGLGAGFFMTMTRSILRVYFSEMDDPSKILESTNKHIYKDSNNGMFVTCFLLVIDTENKTITYSNAGHLPQFLIKKYSISTLDSIHEMHTHGKPLGFIENATYQNKQISYSSSDTIILFTDGITETFNKSEEEYGEERLKSLLKNDYDNAKELVDDIVNETVSFRGKTPQFDDITLLVARLLN
ncbi:GAF domain-containing SpoIIE family protein phosphatase [Brachyspira hyodysenteriae]|uniref:Serine/threonine protein phosphatase n=1 Tax=Brachyspira hyodysenteriae ATCC 27164 TaxID=1266923 RepID=A0A3B6VPM0_BRAHO|nr:SpoIIE family protein phosphatase [Brachyspira hyodysenteriae]ANN62600.1 serine/threonine protein phosphatase [Brachyspira hyodysenteriae ATCC 27164]KLI20892.1 serine/threonine protein phosphatase [Brachyspira hyodysenteriae]KLI28920.1 serine/threonine protein phosphatase [Brachyspira hyodysenteriae]KLI33096.1 serine/threonine protein phosphatase [Brachyspira hyodysenteriae]KLI61582.1 serine/threonine protein phosphatase [Brachyspira hyodysenteriae]